MERLAEATLANNARSPFDLIFMDLQMPVMDGYEATKTILDMPQYRSVPIFALTAHAFDEEKRRCFDLGMKGHLTKPIDVENFYRTLREVAAQNSPAA